MNDCRDLNATDEINCKFEKYTFFPVKYNTKGFTELLKSPGEKHDNLI